METQNKMLFVVKEKLDKLGTNHDFEDIFKQLKF